jgi:hypothetical protein
MHFRVAHMFPNNLLLTFPKVVVPSRKAIPLWIPSIQIFSRETGRTMAQVTFLLYLNMVLMACFTFSKLLFGRAYNSFHKALLITPLIRASKAICYINSSILSIFSLNLFRYARVDSSSAWMTSKSFLELLFAGMLYWNSLLTCNEGCRCRLAYTPFLATFHSYAYRVLESLRFLAWSGRIYKWSPSYIGQIDN